MSSLKRIGISLFIVLLSILFLITNNVPKSTFEFYLVRIYGSFYQYVDCEDVLQYAVSKESTYTELQNYMSEEIYNNLSIKTKSFYKNENAWDGAICVLSQKQDRFNPDIIYLDVALLYDEGKSIVVHPWIRQLVLEKNKTSWRIVKFIEPGKKWYDPFYIGQIYFFAYP